MLVREKAQVSAMASEPAPPASTEATKPAAEKNTKPAKEKKPRVPKALKEKKPRAPKSAAASHPTYFQMINEAIVALKEKSGSSPYAIAKHMEEKYKSVLPANFRKMLTLQLRNCFAKGKLVKVKGSFKLSEAGKNVPAAAKKPAASDKAKKPKAAIPVASDKAKKPKAAVSVAAKAPKPKAKPDVLKKKRKAPALSPVKPKAGVKKARKATPAKPKQPKSIKSPAAKRARKAAAA